MLECMRVASFSNQTILSEICVFSLCHAVAVVMVV